MTHYAMRKHLITKPEAYNVILPYGQRTEPRPQVTCTESSAKFRHVVFKTWERTNSQTDKQTYIHADPTAAK